MAVWDAADFYQELSKLVEVYIDILKKTRRSCFVIAVAMGRRLDARRCNILCT